MNIAALISGGVDSAVVVHLLCEQGYKPDLFYIKIGMDGDEDLTCTAEEDIELCTATARKYGLSLNIIDLHRQYWDNVVRQREFASCADGVIVFHPDYLVY